MDFPDWWSWNRFEMILCFLLKIHLFFIFRGIETIINGISWAGRGKKLFYCCAFLPGQTNTKDKWSERIILLSCSDHSERLFPISYESSSSLLTLLVWWLLSVTEVWDDRDRDWGCGSWELSKHSVSPQPLIA